MKVLVINSSPKEEEFSTTKTLTKEFVKGMYRAGASIEQFDLHKLNIKFCVGCSSCSTKNIGKCILPDDMSNILFPKFLTTDLLVLATPVYFGMMNAAMKNFIDRLFPYLAPLQSVRDKGVSQEYHGNLPNTVIISAASWNYREAFTNLSNYVQYLFQDHLVGEIYRGNSDWLSFFHGNSFTNKRNEILEATQQAGTEVIMNGVASRITQERISSDMDNLNKIVDFHNFCMEICQDNKLNILQYAKAVKESGIREKLHTIESFMHFMKIQYHESANKNDYSIQFIFRGEPNGNCFIQISNDKCYILQERHKDADLTVSSTLEQLLSVLIGEEEIEKSLTTGRLLVKGNLKAWERLKNNF
ncbi:NAD(P)H-dependent oxidoreductase [Lachnotalea glycerini]|uniref:Flavodoxin family protein n=1 Tax=Lachnotalea glycerini TaxID=1763509 RepID=A0A371JC73_9FIRM|nr:NAD(P)H-dependent oxidoreductase [Lachnotalea glycerini]RDY30277.1 hypothetical protein CG710_015515 [Lachnotalea glycerini]